MAATTLPRTALPQSVDDAAPTALVHRERVGAVAVLTLDHPASRNALSTAMIAALDEAFRDLETDRAVRCIVLTASGPAFSAGHDLKEIIAARADADGGRRAFEALMARCAELMTRITTFPKPVIAALEGVATAAGCQLVASCDLAVAGDGARFCTPGVRIGLFCSTPAVPLIRALAPKHAMEMLLLGGMTSAEDAVRFGLVNRVVPSGDALEAALAWGRAISANSAEAVRFGKRALQGQRDGSLDEAYRKAGAIMVENLLHAEAAEGIAAFAEKRQPEWPSHAPDTPDTRSN